MISLRALLAVLAACALAGLAERASAFAASTTHAERVVLPDGVTPEHYTIEVRPNASASTFTALVRIDLLVERPTRVITLNAAEITFHRVTLSGLPEAPRVNLDVDRQTATLTFAREIAAGRHTLGIDYAGKINTGAAGLFALDYDAPKSAGGGRRRSLFTQFENSDARRFVPSWDEPNRKATFTLSAVVPANLMAVSNMPATADVRLPGGLKRVTFRETPKMSSYLLFFGVGDFERVHKDVDGVDVGVIVARGAGDQAQYALDAAAHLLPFYNEYFGIKYPLPKLDMVAGSGQSQFFGAMENWGAIFFFDSDLLIDDRISTPSDRQGVYLTVAHEMAHQWFGDLVTMDWWEDLWLNEGFASWMENKAVDHFHPEWNVRLQEMASKQDAMGLDARRGTHPVIQPIADVLQAQQAFDDITYQKGAAVIRMFEAHVGADAWREGVRRYIRTHAYGNSITDDLWRDVDSVGAGKVTDIAHDFTRQSGVPLLRVEGVRCPGDGATGVVRLAQRVFSVDGSSAGAVWRVPASLAAIQPGAPGARPADRVETVVAQAPVGVRLECAGPVVVNAGQAGYFRTLYAPGAFAALQGSFSRLAYEDQFGLLNDAAALGASGDEPMADVLRLTSTIPSNTDPVVATAMVGELTAIDDLYRGETEEHREAWRAHARSVIAPLFANLGWRPRWGEPDNVASLRTAVITALGQLNDAEVVAETNKLFSAYRTDPLSLDAATRKAVLIVVAQHANPNVWEQIHALARSSASAVEKNEYFTLLGSARDPILAGRALSIALTTEPEKTTAPSMVLSVAHEHAAMALDFAIQHASALNALLEPDSRNQYIPRIAQISEDAEAIAKLDAYARDHIPPSAQGDVVKARSAIAYAVRVKATVLPQVDAWLKNVAPRLSEPARRSRS